MSLWWSFTLTIVGVTGLFATYRLPRSRLGPTIALAAQCLWFAYALATGQWWFLASAFAYASVNVYGLARRARG
ncbi:Uncharacterised protein [Mycobacteroides abscessus subsp. abscessus]|nr:Uncharacterised protein [Mycobacteroides abscessus subsp. abscessus]